jgi:hypothetical protein
MYQPTTQFSVDSHDLTKPPKKTTTSEQPRQRQ